MRQPVEHGTHYWRKRLREAGPVRFALIDQTGEADPTDWNLELLLVSGERLRIGAGVEAATLRTVLDLLRA